MMNELLLNRLRSCYTFSVPGPTPYASASPIVATTAYPTTATWNTALQPSTVPTVVPTAGSRSVGKV